MTAASPLVTIGVPVYNGARFLQDALDSILGQDYPNVAIIISDNGSTDDTPDICAAYASKHAAIRYHRVERNRGVTWNFNRLLELAEGKYFLWAAHDDVLLPSFVRRAVDQLESNREAVVCHSYTQPFGTSGVLGDPYIGWVSEQKDRRSRYRHLLEHWELHAAIYGLLRRDAIERTRGFQPIVAGDIVFMVEMVIWGTIVQIPETLQLKRVPEVGEAYHTHPELLSYLTGRPAVRPLIVARRLRASMECVFGVLHARLGLQASTELILDTIVVYVRLRYWAIDLAEWAEVLLGPERYASIRGRLRRCGRTR